jgi:hypothetical protein
MMDQRKIDLTMLFQGYISTDWARIHRPLLDIDSRIASAYNAIKHHSLTRTKWRCARTQSTTTQHALVPSGGGRNPPVALSMSQLALA